MISRATDSRRSLVPTFCMCVGVLGLCTCFTARATADEGAAKDNPAPLVFAVENTGSAFPSPALPALAEAPVIESFPDPFAWANDPLGKTRSTSLSDWEHHRAEMLAMLQQYEIGTKPAVDIATQVTASFTPDADGGTLTVNVTANGQTLTLTSPVTIPANAKPPFPVVIGMNSPTGALPRNDFNSRGIVSIAFKHNQVTTYNRPKDTDPFFKLYGPDRSVKNTGQYAAWAWGVSRLIDGFTLVKDKLPIDMNHIAVTGCSYAGKMALFSGAMDERIALTVAQESGGGGATNWRYSATEKKGSVEGLAQTSHQWFAPQMFQFGNENVNKLPEDHHMLCALVAPRALYVTGNTNYLWLSNPSCYVNSEAVAKTYGILGVADRFGFCINGGHPHCNFPASQEPELAYFLDRFMMGKSDLSKTVATYPGDYSKIDADRWTKWWGTGKAELPATQPAQ